MNFAPIIESMQGWCTPHKAGVLYDYVKKSGGELSIELGTFAGKSLIPIAFAHKELNKGFALGVDSWDKKTPLEGTNAPANNEWWEKAVNYFDMYKHCTDSIDRHDLNRHCGTVRMVSYIFGTLLPNNSITLLHQDSNHCTEVILMELEVFSPKMKKGGYWIIDDCDWPETKEGYSKLPDFGFVLVEDFQKYQVWQKI